MKLAKAAMLLALLSAPAAAQINAGNQAPEPNMPFTMTQVTTFNLPWRMAFLPDGRMLVTEKVGPLWLVTPQGQKRPVQNYPAVLYGGQGGMLGVYVSPNYATDQSVYLTYSEPGTIGGISGSSLALAKAKLVLNDSATPASASLEDLKVIWRDGERGRGGQFGAALAFAPDGKSLFLTSGDRQRFTPAQDPNQPLGKILHLTLDGKPAPDNPDGRQDRRGERRRHQSAGRYRSRQDRAGGLHLQIPRQESDAVRDLDHRPSHALWPGLRARRPVVGGGARPQRRRRAEPDREGQELWLAAGVLRHQL